MDRILNLIKTLNKARDDYYNGVESMTNYEYDKLYDELSYLESIHNIYHENSPTQSVGYEVKSSLEKVKHETPLLSLDKTKSVDDLYKFVSDKNCIFGYKLDGLTVELKYENGVLTQAQTRGNGVEGELITHNAVHFLNVPKQIEYKKKLRIVGEAYIDYETFDKINERLPEDEQYKNPRNLASGSVRQLDSKKCKERNVRFTVFNINEGFEHVDSKHEVFKMLQMLGFNVYKYWTISSSDKNLQDILDHVSDTEKNIPIDGMVMTYDSREYSKSLGATSHHYKSGLAFKWADEVVYTTLRNIILDVGKSGQLSYTAEFDTVQIDGTDVSKATLHNYDYIKELDLGIGDEIGVIKANMIIPQVVENLTRSGTYEKATHCPVCGSELQHNGVHQFCTNYDCDRQVLGRLTHWCSRDAMNIEGLSEETLKAIMSIKFADGTSVLKDVSDIYDLPYNKESLVQLDRFGEKKVNKICDYIEKSKNRPLKNVLYGLSIPSVGKTASKEISKKYGSMRNIIDAVSYYGVYDILGKSIAEKFIMYLNREDLTLLIGKLLTIGLTMEDDCVKIESNINNNISGLNFCVTGSVHHFKNRNELKAKIEELGGKNQSGVSKTTDYLICNDVESASGKNKKAKDLGVKVITEDEFLKLIKED